MKTKTSTRRDVQGRLSTVPRWWNSPVIPEGLTPEQYGLLAAMFDAGHVAGREDERHERD